MRPLVDDILPSRTLAWGEVVADRQFNQRGLARLITPTASVPPNLIFQFAPSAGYDLKARRNHRLEQVPHPLNAKYRPGGSKISRVCSSHLFYKVAAMKLHGIILRKVLCDTKYQYVHLESQYSRPFRILLNGLAQLLRIRD